MEYFGEEMTAKKKRKKQTTPAEAVKNWEKFRQAGYARIWYAALLSMDVEPKVISRHRLQDLAPERYKTYLNRVEILTRRHGVRKPFKDLHHLKAGSLPRNKYVSLKAVAKFAVANKWDGSEEFARKVAPPEAPALDVSTTHISPETAEDELDALPKGLKYEAVRTSALLAVLERTLLTEPQLATELVRGGKLNLAALARHIQASVASALHRENHSVTGYGVDANSAWLARVRRRMEQLF